MQVHYKSEYMTKSEAKNQSFKFHFEAFKWKTMNLKKFLIFSDLLLGLVHTKRTYLVNIWTLATLVDEAFFA